MSASICCLCSLFTECEGFPRPEVVWSSKVNNDKRYHIDGIFTNGGSYWLAASQQKGHGFTIKLSNCYLKIAGVQIKNVKHGSKTFHRVTKGYTVLGGVKEDGQWEQLLKEEFDNPFGGGVSPPNLQTFHLQEAVEVKFIRFDINSYYGGKGGGLDYFAVITLSGNCCLSNV